MKIIKIMLLVLCLFTMRYTYSAADGDVLFPSSIYSSKVVSAEFPRALSRGVKRVIKFQLPGVHENGNIDMQQLIDHWDTAVDNAKESVDKSKAEYDGNILNKMFPKRKIAYEQHVRRVLRRLASIENILGGLIDQNVEKSREMLFTMQNMYLGSYDNWKETYMANLQPFADQEPLKDIAVDTIYNILGIKEDPSEFTYDDINALIITFALNLKNSYPDNDYHEWWTRQMRFVFPNEKGKECYDAWLKGPQKFEEWQNAELASLGLTREGLQELALGKTISIMGFKLDLKNLRAKIIKTISDIESETGFKNAS